MKGCSFFKTFYMISLQQYEKKEKMNDIELPSNCLFTTSFHKVFGLALAVNLIEA